MSVTVTVNGQSGPSVVATNGDTISAAVTKNAVVSVSASAAAAPGGAGPAGPQGPSTTITVGSVSTLAAGSSATVVGTSSNGGANLSLAFGIPAGAAGATGAAGTNGTNGVTPTITASATTLSAGSSATVTATPSNGGANVALAFGIPQGADGAAGSGGGATLSDATPSALGTASAGVSVTASRSDHTHPVPVISYANLTNVPSTFAPSTHTHTSAAISDFFTAAAAAAPVQSVAGRTGTVTLAKADVGLGNVDNTADASKPVSTAQAAADAAVQAHAVQRSNHTGTQLAATISDFATEAAKYGPVTSVNGQTGAVTVSGGGGSGADSLLRSLFVPAAPTIVTALPGNGQATVSWTAPAALSTLPITDYTVQYSTNSGSTWTTFTRAASAVASVTVTGLTNETSVQFRVSATNGVGTGAYSTASTAVTPNVFTPASLANLAVWLDASSASSLYDATSGGSLVGSGGVVRRWQDLSGNGRHVIGSNGPTRSVAAVNGRDALSFSSSYLANTSINVSGASQSLFMVVRFAASGFQIAGGFGTSSSYGALLIESNRSSGSHSATFGGGDGSESSASGGSASNVTKAFGAVLGSGTGSLLINGTSAATVSRASVSSSSGLAIGAYLNEIVPLNGLICEVVYLARTVTAGEISQLQNYFAAKWGL